jgi:HEPN domain-containing protein
MKRPDEQVQRKVREWLVFADEDLLLARGAMNMPGRQGPPYRLIAYHARQCAEKHLKAYLVGYGMDFPYTDNISTLLELCSDDADWPSDVREAEELTNCASTARYPGEATEVTAHEAERAIELAEPVRGRVRAAPRELGVESI